MNWPNTVTKKYGFTAVLILSLLILNTNAFSMDVTLSWDTNDDASHYVVYWGETPGNYSHSSEQIAAPALTYTATNLESKKYYFAVKAFNSFGNSSDFSDEVSNVLTEPSLMTTISTPANNTTINEGSTLSFSASASGGTPNYSYQWDFGTNGPGPSTVQNPGPVSFEDDGTYNINLLVTDSNGKTATDSITVTVLNTPPLATITSPSSDIAITEGSSIFFSGTITGGDGNVTPHWTFGAGGPGDSTALAPGNVTFPTPGSYTVEFTAKDSDNETDSKSVTVTVSNNSPTISICETAINRTISEGESINFCSSVTSGNQPYTFSWDFGNFSIPASQLQNPGSITYSTEGTFTASVTTTDNDGDTHTAQTTVYVTNNAPQAAITSPAINTEILAGTSINFEASVTGGNPPYVHAWNFASGGPAGSASQSPANVLFSTPGTYHVLYTVTDKDNDTDVASVTITVVEPIADTTPMASITKPSEVLEIFEGESIEFIGACSGGNAPLTYNWTFGNGGPSSLSDLEPGFVSFPAKGTYTVQLMIQDTHNDSDTATIDVIVREKTIDTLPVATISKPSEQTTIKEGESILFEGNVIDGNADFIYAWSFGTDGPADYNQEDPGSTTFSNEGDYLVEFTVTDKDGDTSKDTVQIIVEKEIIDTLPTAVISNPSEDRIINEGGQISFQGNVQGGNAPFSHQWDFGGGAPTLSPDDLSQEDPGTITFETEGIYTVTYTVTDMQGDTSYATKMITVNKPYNDISVAVEIQSPKSDMTINEGESIKFEGSAIAGNAPMVYNWNFGNAAPEIATASPGSITFNDHGQYKVTFAAIDNDGDTASAEVLVTVREVIPNLIPKASIERPASDMVINNGEAVSFAGLVTSGNAPYSYSWTFGTSGISERFTEDPGQVQFNNSGTFTVQFTVTDADGDISTTHRTITVKDDRTDSSPVAEITSPENGQTITAGDKISFSGSHSGGNYPFSYLWTFDDSGFNVNGNKSPGELRFSTPGEFTITYKVTDADGDSATDAVTIIVQASSDAPIEEEPIDPDTSDPVVTEEPLPIAPGIDETVSTTPLLEVTINTDANPSKTETRWQVSADEAFSTILYDVQKESESAFIKIPRLVLDPGKRYFWRASTITTLPGRTKTESQWSQSSSFVTDRALVIDTNANGIEDAIESADPDADLDNNGVLDATQDSLVTFNSGTPDGQGIRGMLLPDNVTTVELINAVNETTIESRHNMPSRLLTGLISFRLKVTPGSTISLKLYLSEPAEKKAAWYKYDSVNGWSDYSSHSRFASDRKSLEIDLTDGGTGDADGTVNGIIVDPGGLGIAPDVAVTGSEAEAASCFVNTTIRGSSHVKTWFAIFSLGLLLITSVNGLKIISYRKISRGCALSNSTVTD